MFVYKRPVWNRPFSHTGLLLTHPCLTVIQSSNHNKELLSIQFLVLLSLPKVQMQVPIYISSSESSSKLFSSHSWDTEGSCINNLKLLFVSNAWTWSRQRQDKATSHEEGTDNSALCINISPLLLCHEPFQFTNFCLRCSWFIFCMAFIFCASFASKTDTEKTLVEDKGF